MIRKIIGDTMSIGLVGEESIIITINDSDIMLTVDQMKELRDMSGNFWEVNNLWRLTKEEKEERARYELEKQDCKTGHLVSGLAQATIRG